MSQWELFKANYRPEGDGAAYTLLSEHQTARDAFRGIQGHASGFYVVCLANESPDDWRALYRTEGGVVYQVWGAGGRSALPEVAA